MSVNQIQTARVITSTDLTSPIPSLAPTSVLAASASDGMKIYTARDNNFRFSYPADWTYAENISEAPTVTNKKVYSATNMEFVGATRKSVLNFSHTSNNDFSGMTPDAFLKYIGGPSVYLGGEDVTIGILNVRKAQIKDYPNLPPDIWFVFNKGNTFYTFSDPKNDINKVSKVILTFQFLN